MSLILSEPPDLPRPRDPLRISSSVIEWNVNAYAHLYMVRMHQRGGMRCDSGGVPHLVQAAFYEWHLRYVVLVLFNDRYACMPREDFDVIFPYGQQIGQYADLSYALPELDFLFDSRPQRLIERSREIEPML